MLTYPGGGCITAALTERETNSFVYVSGFGRLALLVLHAGIFCTKATSRHVPVDPDVCKTKPIPQLCI